MLGPLEDDDPVEIGPYRLRARIGSGGMGRVFLAATTQGQPVAVKVVRAELADDAEFRRRFELEVAAARRVHGAFTAELIDADTTSAVPWLATAYIPGPSLQEAVDHHGPLPARTVWQLLAGVAQALRAVHDAGVVHRDLKPANVLLAADGPRVIDFGIARASDTTPVTRTGIRVGSPQFMAPEHARGEQLTGAADVFSLGALAVFAATGRTPFGEGPDAAVLYRVVNEEPDLAGLDDQLREFAAGCLAKNPGDRPGIEAVIATCTTAGTPAPGWLPEALVGHDDVVPPLPPHESQRAERKRGRRRGPRVVVPILAAACVTAAAILVLRSEGTYQADAPGATFNQLPAPALTTVTTSSEQLPVPAQQSSTSQPTTRPVRTTSTTAANTLQHNAGTVTPALLGVPNWDGYCRTTGQGPVQLIRNDAYGWHCTGDNGTGDDAKAVCDWTFHTTQTTNRVQDFNNPNSWQCWQASRKLGSVDFSAYCRLLGFPGAYYVNGRNAYGWYCTNDQNALDLQDACLRLYHSAPPISRFQNFYDPNSWECWG